MTKVLCIDNDYNKIREPWSSGFKNNFWQSKLPCGAKCSLIIGNIYEVMRSDNTTYLISQHGWYYKERFISIEEWRDKKIDDIL